MCNLSLLVVGLTGLVVVANAAKSTEFLAQQQQEMGMSQQLAREQAAAQEQEQAEAQAAAATKSLGEVIALLQQMLHDLDTQKTEDASLWQEYTSWADNTETERTSFIQEQESLVMSTEARLNANRDKVQRLTAEIGQLTTDISTEEASLKELITMRQDEHAQFEASLTDLTKTIRAVTHATEILEGHYNANGASLADIKRRVQLALTMYGVPKSGTAENVQALASFLQGDSSNPDFLNSDGAGYESYQKQGGAGGVIGMLTDLRGQLEAQRQSLVATENDSQRQYEAAKATKEADIARMKDEKATKEGEKTTAEAQIEQDIVTIDEAKTAITEAKQYLVDLRADREKFQKQFQDRHSLRNDEMAATQAALDALQSVSLGAKSGVASFFQVSSKKSSRTGRMLSRLVDLGHEVRAPALIQLASHMRLDYMGSSQQQFDPGSFGPVLKLLNDLITRLEEEANAETTTHDWCETEKETSEAQKEERETNIHNLKADIEQLTTEIATLKTEVEFMQSEVDRVKAETAAAKEQRRAEHELFVQSKADHDEVIGAIRLALEALGGQFAASFVQTSMRVRQPSPGGGGALFNDQAGGSAGAGSAMEMLQDLLQRYESALQTLITDENEQQTAHEELLRVNAQFVADTTATINAKISERRSKITSLADDKHEMKSNLIELHEVGKYLMDLRPSCDDIRTTYEDRKKRREAEIAALKEALQVLQDPSMQQ